jgi:DNA invertase Pin-like site-specific DNA recombinase
MLRAALYARVSTQDKQDVALQLRDLNKIAKANNWKSTEFIEKESGANRRRPVRNEILKLAARRSIDVVAVWKLDRWSRSTVDLLQTIDQLSSQRVAFYSFTESLDLTTPGGRALMGMLAVFAEFERDIIRERLKAGITNYRNKNGKWGRPPTVALLSPEIISLHNGGMSKRSIANKLKVSRGSVIAIIKSSKRQKKEGIE